MSRRRVILWRHGRTQWNVERRKQGSADIPLDAEGHRQARVSAERIAETQPHLIVTSPLRRAAQTAGYLAERVDRPVDVDAQLAEIAYGIREGLTKREARERYPDLMRAWKGDPEFRFPGAESATDAAARFVSAVERALRRLDPDGTAVIVSHRGVLIAGTARFLELPVTHWNRLAGLGCCSWAVLAESGGGSSWQIAEWNTSVQTRSVA